MIFPCDVYKLPPGEAARSPPQLVIIDRLFTAAAATSFGQLYTARQDAHLILGSVSLRVLITAAGGGEARLFRLSLICEDPSGADRAALWEARCLDAATHGLVPAQGSLPTIVPAGTTQTVTFNPDLKGCWIPAGSTVLLLAQTGGTAPTSLQVRAGIIGTFVPKGTLLPA